MYPPHKILQLHIRKTVHVDDSKKRHTETIPVFIDVDEFLNLSHPKVYIYICCSDPVLMKPASVSRTKA